nr:immunoglobulin heavy chain junction region [Macaca mulatta]MOX64538.1 immunoglobulin heavy chain junction region [Macaca mulatta]MOX66600.1 immunoglobulin heavy chain junction region [Macaca mulatta]MOX67897.1 immunoglobulin heavy chain junction region [Macaca mulatta]MOX68664.1 immunoglobulin heavy chain junction region [Macaca mulatta]
CVRVVETATIYPSFDYW